jgi:hypothetical protein
VPGSEELASGSEGLVGVRLRGAGAGFRRDECEVDQSRQVQTSTCVYCRLTKVSNKTLIVLSDNLTAVEAVADWCRVSSQGLLGFCLVERNRPQRQIRFKIDLRIL